MALDGVKDTQVIWDTEVAQALKLAFWFNLGFAIEWRAWNDVILNMDKIRADVIWVLTETRIRKIESELNQKVTDIEKNEIEERSASNVNSALTNEILQAQAQKYRWYTNGVKSRITTSLDFTSKE